MSWISDIVPGDIVISKTTGSFFFIISVAQLYFTCVIFEKQFKRFSHQKFAVNANRFFNGNLWEKL